MNGRRIRNLLHYHEVKPGAGQKLCPYRRVGRVRYLDAFLGHEWSLRWYGLAALLLVWAALGSWTLIHTALPNKEARKEKEYKTRRIVVKAVTMLLLVTVALIPPLVFPQYELIKTTGEHKVATVLYTYTDKNRVETYTKSGWGFATAT